MTFELSSMTVTLIPWKVSRNCLLMSSMDGSSSTMSTSNGLLVGEGGMDGINQDTLT
ncbi:MAG: hypothetical protein A4E29_00446 [Methanomassiliicoccales archaeon PtaB.Bin134]|nr:MAG: hypothetical protein A4E29_00446 [Methanomassiliicoccales archaeon PtaB.Bin134]